MAGHALIPVRPLEDILEETASREASLEVYFVDEAKVCCEGSGGVLGHPKVYYTIKPEKGYVECQYCDRLYVFDPSRAGTVIEGGFIEGRQERPAELNAL